MQRRRWNDASPEKRRLRHKRQEQQRQALSWEASCKTHPQLESSLIQGGTPGESFGKETPLLLTTAHATKRVKKLLLAEEEWRDTRLDFNPVEVKSHLGADTSDGALGGSGEQLRPGRRREINAHSDCTFDGDGRQLGSNSTEANHPIAAVCDGGTRNLALGRRRQGGLRETADSRGLRCSPVFALLPADDKAPRKVSGAGKVAHEVEFLNSGVSTAVVFCHAESHKAREFGSKAGLWEFGGKKSAERLLEKSKVAFDGLHCTAMHRGHASAVDRIGQRMVRVLKRRLSWKRLEERWSKNEQFQLKKRS